MCGGGGMFCSKDMSRLRQRRWNAPVHGASTKRRACVCVHEATRAKAPVKHTFLHVLKKLLSWGHSSAERAVAACRCSVCGTEGECGCAREGLACPVFVPIIGGVFGPSDALYCRSAPLF